MRPLSRDYDADPSRFLSTDRHPHDDVHPYVAARFAAAGARTVLDVGGGHGRLARLLPRLALRGLLVDLSPAMLDLAPRPAVRADGARLPVADASVDAVAALYTLYHYDDPRRPIREARRVLRPGGLFAACAPNRDSTPELAKVIPGWGAGTTFDGEDAEAIVASVFSAPGDTSAFGDISAPGDTVETDRWDGPLVTLGSAADAAAFLRVHRLDAEAAAEAAAGLDLPMTLTMRGCVVYATKAGAGTASGRLPGVTLSIMAADLLPPFPADAFRRVLCVVAHPDDVEYGTSSAVAAWTARGVEVAYLLLTRGEAGMDGSPPERTAQLRTEEQIASSGVVGVTEVEFLGYPDGVLEYSLGMRRDIARVIRRRQPDAVLVGSWDVEFAAGLNQADHRVAGLAALDALRDAGNRWVFPELLDEGLPPHAVRWLLIGGDPRPTHGVDVTGEPLEGGIAALEAHAQYLAGLPGHPPVRLMISGITALMGRAMGVPNAVLFRAWDFQAPPPIAAEIMAAAQDG